MLRALCEGSSECAPRYYRQQVNLENKRDPALVFFNHSTHLPAIHPWISSLVMRAAFVVNRVHDAPVEWRWSAMWAVILIPQWLPLLVGG